MIDEHDYIVEIPEDIAYLHPDQITDPVAGWFLAEVQLIVCKDCGHRDFAWRPVRGEKSTFSQQEDK